MHYTSLTFFRSPWISLICHHRNKSGLALRTSFLQVGNLLPVYAPASPESAGSGSKLMKENATPLDIPKMFSRTSMCWHKCHNFSRWVTQYPLTLRARQTCHFSQQAVGHCFLVLVPPANLFHVFQLQTSATFIVALSGLYLSSILSI